MELIYAIPGLGTTKDLYKNISIPNYQLKVLDWPEPKPNYTLQQYAQQFLKQINTTEPVILMGVSFGGMLCSELAEQIETKKVFLISSCKDSSEFPLLLKSLKRVPLYKLTSDKVIRFLAKTKRKMLGFEKSYDRLFFEMILQMPEHYFSSCINYIIQWNRKESQNNFIRIHGTNDKLLTYTNKSFHLVKGGTHAMVLTKGKEINEILNNVLNEL